MSADRRLPSHDGLACHAAVVVRASNREIAIA
jgi:hypothetical protein